MKTIVAKNKALCLDHNSFEPLHAQAERLLHERMRQPEYAQGALLPPEVSLVKGIKVETCLTTVRLVPANEVVARGLQIPAEIEVLCLDEPAPGVLKTERYQTLCR